MDEEGLKGEVEGGKEEKRRNEARGDKEEGEESEVEKKENHGEVGADKEDDGEEDDANDGLQQRRNAHPRPVGGEGTEDKAGDRQAEEQRK